MEESTEQRPGDPDEGTRHRHRQRLLEVPKIATVFDIRVAGLSFVAVLIGLASGVAAELLLRLIGLITNISFYGRWSTAFVSPAHNHLGLIVLVVPVIGGIVIGFMARYGSPAIRGHGIPEAMERVLTRESRIRPRVGILKPVSAAIAIGTGCPFGAEGPIIVTGGAIGSLVGQMLTTTAEEKKILLAAGAAAGMAATFGSPISGVLLAVELLLFEFRPRSLVPVAFASASAAMLRTLFGAPWPIFPMREPSNAGLPAMAAYLTIAAIVGLGSVGATRAMYAIEDLFKKLPIHWMWWPAIGGLAVGAAGYILPATLGVGYDQIDRIFSGGLTEKALILLCALKFVSWAVSLGSGTSSGTLAPLFVIGGTMGAALGGGAHALFPGLAIDPRIAGIVGMAAMFAGASRALLTSIVFAFETTLQPLGLLPLLSGCAAAYMISSLLMKTTLMTEKIARRGVFVPSEYLADFLARMPVREAASREVVSLRSGQTLEEVRSWITQSAPGSRHQGFPVLSETGELLGVATRRDLLDPSQPLDTTVGALTLRNHAVIFEDNTLRDANDLMARTGVGRLPVVVRGNPNKVMGILSRRDIMIANQRRIAAEYELKKGKWPLRFAWPHRRGARTASAGGSGRGDRK